MKQTIEVPLSIELKVEEMDLVEAGLRLLLMVEDDHDTIARLKELLKRLQQEIAVHAV